MNWRLLSRYWVHNNGCLIFGFWWQLLYFKWWCWYYSWWSNAEIRVWVKRHPQKPISSIQVLTFTYNHQHCSLHHLSNNLTIQEVTYPCEGLDVSLEQSLHEDLSIPHAWRNVVPLPSLCKITHCYTCKWISIWHWNFDNDIHSFSSLVHPHFIPCIQKDELKSKRRGPLLLFWRN